MIEKIKSYEDLIVYQRSFELALELHKLSITFPKIEQFALGDQLRRSSKSICANIAEGFSRRSHSVPEFKRFLSVAFGSSEETRVWISFAYRLGYK
jgi:four helix bundle protein